MEKTFVISSDDRHSTKTVKEIMSSFVLIYTLDNSFQMRMISSKNETRAALYFRRHFYTLSSLVTSAPPKDYGHGCDRVNDIPVGWQGNLCSTGHSQRLKINIEENKTFKSYFTCSLSSLLGFWVVLELFRFYYFDVSEILAEGTTPRRDSFIFFKIHF